MPRGDNLTKKDRIKAGEVTRNHGVYAVESRGEEALRGPAEKGRYQELRELVRTYPGRVELKEELATLAMMIVELGATSLRETHNEGGNIFSDKAILKALSPYMNVANKVLDSLPDAKERADHAQLVGEMTERVKIAKAGMGTQSEQASDADDPEDGKSSPEQPEKRQGEAES